MLNRLSRRLKVLADSKEVIFRDARRRQKIKISILGMTLNSLRSLFEECWVTVHRRSTPFVFYAAMVCAKLVCKLYFKVSLWPSCCMLHQLGVDSRLLRTVSELTHFSAEASDGVSVARTHPHSRYCWRTVINNCFARSWTIRNTFYTVCYRHPRQLHNTTNFDSGHTTENCQTILAA